MPPDSLRAVLDSVFSAPAYRWPERPEPLAQVRRWSAALLDWLNGLREHNPLGFRLVTAALIIGLVAILVHAAWVLIRTVRPAVREPGAPGPALPRRSRQWYRQEADRLAALGRYGEAMQADFLELMLAFDAAELVRFHPGKTPREYTREPRLAPPLRDGLSELVATLYGCAFAGRRCDGPQYGVWQERVREALHAAPH